VVWEQADGNMTAPLLLLLRLLLAALTAASVAVTVSAAAASWRYQHHFTWLLAGVAAGKADVALHGQVWSVRWEQH